MVCFFIGIITGIIFFYSGKIITFKLYKPGKSAKNIFLIIAGYFLRLNFVLLMIVIVIQQFSKIDLYYMMAGLLVGQGTPLVYEAITGCRTPQSKIDNTLKI